MSAFLLDVADTISHEMCLVPVFELFQFLVLDVHAHTATGGLQLHQMLSQLRVLIVQSQWNLTSTLSRVDKSLYLMPSASFEEYLMEL